MKNIDFGSCYTGEEENEDGSDAFEICRAAVTRLSKPAGKKTASHLNAPINQETQDQTESTLPSQMLLLIISG